MICPSGIAVVKFKDEQSGVVHNTSANLSNGNIVAKFPNLTENTLYQPSASMYNNGMMLQESSHVDTTQEDASKCYLYHPYFSYFHNTHRHV